MRKTRLSTLAVLSSISLVRRLLLLTLALSVGILCATAVSAQSTKVGGNQLKAVDLYLPDAPESARISASSTESSSAKKVEESTPVLQADGRTSGSAPIDLKVSLAGSPTDITVLPGHAAPSQSVRDKMVGSIKDSISPFSLIGETISAGYSHVTNGSPNFGTDAPAFGQRFGASIARGTSQNIFSEGVLAALLHEDPRYYQMGSGKPFFKRITYAASRPLITRTDGGRSTPNFALLGGYLGAATLTKTYYPPTNQGFDQTLQTYGGSIGGSALGYVVTEFLGDTLQILHLKKAN